MLTLASFVALFVYLQNDCEAQSMTAATMTISSYIKKTDISCVHFALKVVEDEEGKQTFTPCRMLDMDPTTFEMEPLPLDLCPNNIAGIGYAKTIEVDNPDVLPAHLQNGGVDMTSEEQEDSNDDEDSHHDDNGMGRRRSEDDNSGESDENKGGV